VEDAYVDDGHPFDKLGREFFLRVDGAPTSQITLLRFKVEHLKESFTSARLQLFCADSDREGIGITVSVVTSGAWTEEDVTWDKRPTEFQEVARLGRIDCGLDPIDCEAPLAVTREARTVEYDVSAWVQRNATYNFALTTNDNEGITFCSKETYAAPQLLITTPPP
jgi:hypothetical protein